MQAKNKYHDKMFFLAFFLSTAFCIFFFFDFDNVEIKSLNLLFVVLREKIHF